MEQLEEFVPDKLEISDKLKEEHRRAMEMLTHRAAFLDCGECMDVDLNTLFSTVGIHPPFHKLRRKQEYQ